MESARDRKLVELLRSIFFPPEPSLFSVSAVNERMEDEFFIALFGCPFEDFPTEVSMCPLPFPFATTSTSPPPRARLV
jgi:hypothetical protein